MVVMCFGECDAPDCDWGWVAAIPGYQLPGTIACPWCSSRVEARPCGDEYLEQYLVYLCDPWGCVIPRFVWQSLRPEG